MDHMHINRQMAHLIIDSVSCSCTQTAYRVHWLTSIFPQLRAPLFALPPPPPHNTETLDCLENLFDVHGLWMCRLGRHAFTLVLQSCYQHCFVFARGDLVPCFCGLELQSFLYNCALCSVGSGTGLEMMEKGNNKFINKATTCFFFLAMAVNCSEKRRHIVVYVTSASACRLPCRSL